MRLLTARRVGNVHVFLDGRVIIGPDWTVLLATLGQIIVGALVFVCYTNTKNGARAVVGTFAMLSLGFLFHCGLRDPGICPKALPPLVDSPPHDPIPVPITFAGPDGSPQTKLVERRWCYSCNIYRPVRSVHCRFCDVCVCRRDHHCPWTGICIGARNYPSYFGLVWCAFVMALTAVIGGIVSLVHRTRVIQARREALHVPASTHGNVFGAAIAETWGAELILLVASVLWAAMSGSLATYHTHLILNNKTSADDAKLGSDRVNCYDRGSALANIYAACVPHASFMYDGYDSLAGGAETWTVVVEDEVTNKEAPMATTGTAAATEHGARREDAEAMLKRSLPTVPAATVEGRDADAPENANSVVV